MVVGIFFEHYQLITHSSVTPPLTITILLFLSWCSSCYPLLTLFTMDFSRPGTAFLLAICLSFILFYSYGSLFFQSLFPSYSSPAFNIYFLFHSFSILLFILRSVWYPSSFFLFLSTCSSFLSLFFLSNSLSAFLILCLFFPTLSCLLLF